MLSAATLASNLDYLAFAAREYLPRSLPASVRGGNGSPSTTIASTLAMLDRNLAVNPATLVQSYRGRPRYLQRRQPHGLRRFRHQIPLRWNALLGDTPTAPAS